MSSPTLAGLRASNAALVDVLEHLSDVKPSQHADVLGALDVPTRTALSDAGLIHRHAGAYALTEAGEDLMIDVAIDA